ncbi:sensor histidine kinase [Pseudomonas quasicaspiana]|uniref:sensor histidine kinase n=1 Tax=Pseudomonas quasicaspiana TaxID=2829821 RepID=UPI001E3FD88F|nr:PAS domain-containing sensor histidine kinase [Pseudomonas quasicaspiana]MCD5979532.1 PAS domain-containing protein [Pseudomonas quasicaspiana]
MNTPATLSAGHAAAAPNARSSSLLLRLGAIAITTAVFIIDTVTSLDVAVAVLYVMVILLSVNIFSRHGLTIVALSCLFLTIISFLLTHGQDAELPAVARCLVSIAAIGITTVLARSNKAVNDRLQEQVCLLAEAHQALRRSEAFLIDAQRLSRTGSVGFRVPDLEMHWSEETQRIFEYEAAAHASMDRVLQRTHPDDLVLVLDSIAQARKLTPDLSVEHRLLMPDGRIKHLHMLAHLTHDQAGNCEYVGALMDVTASKQAEEALHRSQTELAHVTRVTTLGELAASIAHEVNQPLAAVTTNAEASLRWLNRREPDITEAAQALERILSETFRASEVIRRIRALSRKADPQRAAVDLQEIIEDSVSLIAREIQRARVELVQDIARDVPRVMGDRIQLQQVLISLLINGMQAMGGNQGSLRKMSVRLHHESQNEVLVEVRDSGPGIQLDDMGRLFNAFFTTKPEGMGMGLSICRSIIDAHGGRIWAQSEPGEGAVLLFALPREPEPPHER